MIKAKRRMAESRPTVKEENQDQAVQMIRGRLKQKREEYADFMEHCRIRLQEQDTHGIWDCAVCATEVSNYIDGLEFCLQSLGQKP